ncbi:MAG: hypothetical protein R2836_05855 [Chitinophagales bacterium]
MLLTICSCSKENYSTIYEQKSVFGFFKINGMAAPSTENESGNNFAVDYMNASVLPAGNINQIEISMYFPTDNSVDITAGLEEVKLVLNNGTIAYPFFENIVKAESDVSPLDNINRQRFVYYFTYPSTATPINASNLNSFEFRFSATYKDKSSQTVLDNKIYSATIYTQ